MRRNKIGILLISQLLSAVRKKYLLNNSHFKHKIKWILTRKMSNLWCSLYHATCFYKSRYFVCNFLLKFILCKSCFIIAVWIIKKLYPITHTFIKILIPFFHKIERYSSGASKDIIRTGISYLTQIFIACKKNRLLKK